MDTSLDELAGIWAHIVKFSPSQEVNEIKNVIGSDFIEENQSLWREVKALKSILFEMGSNLAVVRQGNTGRASKQSIAKAKNFSNLYYAEGKEGENIYSIKKFSLDIVANDLSKIKQLFETEQTSLEKEINQLNNEMDNQSESMLNAPDEPISSVITPFSSMDLSSMICSICKSKLSSKVDPTKRGPVPNPKSKFTCSICKEKKLIQESKIYGSNVGRNAGAQMEEMLIQDFSKKLLLSSQSEATIPGDKFLSSNSNEQPDDDEKHRGNNNNNSSPGSLSLSVPVSSRSSLSSGGRGSSKFRSRLNSARDELHFLDEC